MRKPKRLGVIGCGEHARRSHVAVAHSRDFRVTAVFDPASDSVAEMLGATGLGVAVCRSAEELTARPDVDAVLIASPDQFHPAQLELVVRGAGRPVLCEKPLAVDAEGLERVDATLSWAEAHDVAVASCHPRRDQYSTDLAYAWVQSNLALLVERFGRLKRIGLHSSYPRPSMEWKRDRSFLIDKFVHDIDYLRWLLGDRPFTAERLVDGFDHYEVRGAMDASSGEVEFHCIGTRLHGGKGDYVEIITLNFHNGACIVYNKTGLVRYWDHRTGKMEEDTQSVYPMTSDGYDRVFRGLMHDFAVLLDGGPGVHTLDDLRVNTRAVVALAGPTGKYEYAK